MNLNPEQQEAVEHFDGPCIVTAVPGSGKTATLTARVVRLIHRGVDPKNILCLTFTNKAANEMRERVATQIGQLSSAIWIGTFHGLFLAVLRKYGHFVGLTAGFSVYDDKAQETLLEKIARMQEYRTDYRAIKFLAKSANDFRENIEDFEEIARSLTPTEASIVKEYIETLDEFNAVDFSGILYKTYLLLKQNPKVGELLANKFKYVLGDEWQDTNTIQYEISKILANHGNLFVVADRNQSIFSWRGAKPSNLDAMNRDFPNVREIVLPRNYRSTVQILKRAECLIHHNDDAADVQLISEVGNGPDVVALPFANAEMESQGVANALQSFHRQGYKWNDCAILYRTNSQSKLPEIALRQDGIPYRVVGGFSFFDRKEIKTALAYLACLANPRDTIAFARAIQTPRRHLGPTTIGKLERICQQNKISILDACNRDDLDFLGALGGQKLHEFVLLLERYREAEVKGTMTLPQIADGILRDSGYHAFLAEESKADKDWQKRIDNLNELVVGMAEFESQKPKSKVADYLQSIELITSDEAEDEQDAVTLLTMHSAKGLEFPIVFIIGVERDIIPHKAAIIERGEEEERRLMYVAATRAKTNLLLTHSRSRSQYNKNGGYRTMPAHPSKFLYEMDLADE